MAGSARITKKAPAQSQPRRVTKAPVGQQHGPGDPWFNRQAFEITPFKSKGHYNQFKRYDPDLAELKKAETIHKFGSWDKVPFVDPGGRSWTPEKASNEYGRMYAKHRADGKTHDIAHHLAGLHSGLFDEAGRPRPDYRKVAVAAAKAAQAAHPASEVADDPSALGVPLTPKDTQGTSGTTTIFERNPDIVDRGLEGHQSTLKKLAAAVYAHGISPHEGIDNCRYDLAWMTPAGSLYVAEVKSLTGQNENAQLRLGLGQVLDYAQFLEAAGHTVTGTVLAVERPPRDKRWVDVCKRAGVTLVWPSTMNSLFD
jgi:hypothetical protein